MVTCCACKGKKIMGHSLGVDLPCPYCNKTGKLKNKEEERSVGLRIGIYHNSSIQLNLFTREPINKVK